jgi:UDP-N-acetylglucosamine 1-carboxyvinyltransferase
MIGGAEAEFRGVPALRPADIEARDIRSGAGLAIAGLAARGVTMLSGVAHIWRGYEGFVENIRALGGDMELLEV